MQFLLLCLVIFFDDAVSSKKVDSSSLLLNFMNHDHVDARDMNPLVEFQEAVRVDENILNIDPDEIEGLQEIAEDLMSSVVINAEHESDKSPRCTKKLHHACLIDTWAAGNEKIIEINPMSIQMEAQSRIHRGEKGVTLHY